MSVTRDVSIREENITVQTDASCLFTGSTMNGERGCFFSGSTAPFYGAVEPAMTGPRPFDSLDQDPLVMIPRSMIAALCFLGPLTCVAHGGDINGEATYISFSVPGALGTYPMSINASITVVGYYYVTPTATRGFLRGADGTITTFNIPKAVLTIPESINSVGDVTGFYTLPTGMAQGFLRYADGDGARVSQVRRRAHRNLLSACACSRIAASACRPYGSTAH
jgi:hypothetical protein